MSRVIDRLAQRAGHLTERHQFTFNRKLSFHKFSLLICENSKLPTPKSRHSIWSAAIFHRRWQHLTQAIAVNYYIYLSYNLGLIGKMRSVRVILAGYNWRNNFCITMLGHDVLYRHA